MDAMYLNLMFINPRPPCKKILDPRLRGGGVSYIQKGGFRKGISGVDPNCCRALGKSTSKQKLQTAVGGVSDHPPKKPVSAPATDRGGSRILEKKVGG